MATEKKEPEKKTDPWGEMVSIKLFKDNGNYKDDVFVSVNGRNYQIQRGKTVQVPRCVAEVLEHSERQDQAAALMVDELEREYGQHKK
nr:MAG TPA: hypothetical protein [Caudoviricetes sp.]